MILITGASGFLGQHLSAQFKTLDALCRLGHSSGVCCDRQTDLTDSAALNALLEEVRPSLVLHSAALRDPDICVQRPEAARKLHVDATAQLASWCREHGAKLVYISTDYVFDGKNPPYDEQSRPNPLNLYGQTKLLGEEAVRQCPDHIIARISLQYGATERPELSFVHKAIKRLQEGTPVPLDNCQRRFPALSSDVARALRLLVERDFKGVIHMGNPKSVTRLEMWRLIARTFGLDESLPRDLGRPQQQSAQRPYDCTFDLGLYDSLGLPPFKDFASGLAEIAPEIAL